MKAYPDDLRKKVLTAYQEGKGSMRQLTVVSVGSETVSEKSRIRDRRSSE